MAIRTVGDWTMTNKKVSPKLGQSHFQMLCALAEYQGVSLTQCAADGLRQYLEATYRNAHPTLRAHFDKHLGISLHQEGNNPGTKPPFIIQ